MLFMWMVLLETSYCFYNSGWNHQKLDEYVRGWMKHVLSSICSFISAMIVAIPALLEKEAIVLIALMLLDGAAISYMKEHVGPCSDEWISSSRMTIPAMTKEWAAWENNAFLCVPNTVVGTAAMAMGLALAMALHWSLSSASSSRSSSLGTITQHNATRSSSRLGRK